MKGVFGGHPTDLFECFVDIAEECSVERDPVVGALVVLAYPFKYALNDGYKSGRVCSCQNQRIKRFSCGESGGHGIHLLVQMFKQYSAHGCPFVDLSKHLTMHTVGRAGVESNHIVDQGSHGFSGSLLAAH